MFNSTKIKQLKLFKNYNNPSIVDIFLGTHTLSKIDMRHLSVDAITSLLIELEKTGSRGHYLTIYEDAPSTDKWKPVLLKQMQVVLPKPLRRLDNIKDSLIYDKNSESYTLIQNIEEIALTGLEETWEYSNNIFSLPLNTTNIFYNNHVGVIKSTSLRPSSSLSDDKEIMLKDNKIQILDSSFSTLDEFKENLKDNPIYVQYQLQDSIIHDIDIVDRFITNTVSFNLNKSIPSLNALVEANVEYIDVSGVSPKTKYTLQFNSEFGGTFELRLGTLELSINSLIGFNSRVITTTDNVGDGRLLLYKNGVVLSDVMLIEGQYNEELPYFEGLLSVGKTFTDGTQKIVIESSIDATVYHGENELVYDSKVNTQNDVSIQGQTLVNACLESKTLTLDDKINETVTECNLADLQVGSKLDFCIQGSTFKNEVIVPMYYISTGVLTDIEGSNVVQLPDNTANIHLTTLCEGNTELKDGKLVSTFDDNFIMFLISNSHYLWGNSNPWKGGK
jgi:hypothetical protein